MRSRRLFLTGGLAAPALLMARKTYTFAELEKLLARGDLKGKVSRNDLPTPALILDLDAFESNVQKMASFVKGRGKALRPHAKTHKCPEVAKALIRAGAVGACAAKISEGEALADHGVTGLLITSAVIGRHKIEQAVRLAQKRPETIFSADNAQNVRDLNDAAGAAKIKFNIAIDLYVGRRTGIVPGEPAAALATLVASLPNLKLAGLQSYAGHASHTQGWENRKRVSEEAMGQAVETRRLIEKSGVACPLVTGGSTGTYNIDSEIEGVTELQPGSFMFMDVDYAKIGGRDGDPVYRDFAYSLFVATTVISKPLDDVAIVDGGFKAFATDRQFGPEPKGRDDLKYAFAGDEHGRLTPTGPTLAAKVGDRIEFVIPHCDPTVNLYDRIYGVRGEQVETVWKIAARGMAQ